MTGGRLGLVRSDLQVVLPAWVTARLLLAAAWLAVRLAGPGSGGGPRPVDRGLLAWDGDWYQSLLVHGYDGVPAEGVRFFPGFVLAGRLADAILPGGPGVALVVLANVSALVATVLLHRLVVLETGNRALARRAVWALSLFPPAFVLAWAYGEGLFLALAVGVLLCARRERWLTVALLALGAGLVRPTGALLAVPVLAAVWRPTAGSGRLPERIAAVVAGPAGVGIFVWWASAHFDEAFIPMNVQRSLRGDPVNPIRRLVDGVGELFGGEALGDGLHIVAVATLLALLAVLLRRWPLRYGAFAASCLVVALAADNLNSLERYALNGVPFVLAVATLGSRRRLGPAVVLFSAAAMPTLAALAWWGSYVP